MTKVFITDYIESDFIEKEVLNDYLGNEIGDNTEVVLVWHEKINAKFLDKVPNLKAVIRYGVGYDNIDLNEACNREVIIANTPDYGTEEVSDTAMAMILNITRGVTRYDHKCRKYISNWQENTISNIKRTSDIKLGVIGAGRIGGSVILKANAMGFQTSFYDPYRDRGYEKMLQSNRFDSLDELLADSDIISFHAPLSNETYGMVNESFISKMKDGASFVNTARGKVVKSLDVFLEPLKSNKLNCVSLDVLPEEPPINGVLLNEWRARADWLDGRLIINPHSAYFSSQSFKEMRQKAAKNALRVINNQEPFNIIKLK